MSESKKKFSPKKAVAKKAPPKKEVPKTVEELKKTFRAARKANPEKHAELRAEYLKNKKALRK